MTSNKLNRLDAETADQLRQALRRACTLATTLGMTRGARARETKLALRATDALQELKDLLESQP